jgi:hypothetical protein
MMNRNCKYQNILSSSEVFGGREDMVCTGMNIVCPETDENVGNMKIRADRAERDLLSYSRVIYCKTTKRAISAQLVVFIADSLRKKDIPLKAVRFLIYTKTLKSLI